MQEVLNRDIIQLQWNYSKLRACHPKAYIPWGSDNSFNDQ